MKKKIETLIDKYYSRLEADINSTVIQVEKSEIDYHSFYAIAICYVNRFEGQIDSIYDLDYITYDEWHNYFDKGHTLFEDNLRIVRKMQYEPSDPEDN